MNTKVTGAKAGVLGAIPFGLPGGVDDETGRMGLTIEQWQHTDNPDLPIYWATPGSFGGEEWAYVDGIDLHTNGLNADVWFESGQCVTVPVGRVIYMARKHAEPLLPETLRAALANARLIAASPKMLSVLQALERRFATSLPDSGSLVIIREAIAEATGTTP